MAGDWLDNAEVLVLQPLEDSPQPLWALRWHEETTLLALAAILAPGLISLEARGLVEVRHFRFWPARWDEGEPLTGDELARESARAEIWSEATAEGVLAAHITEAGYRFCSTRQPGVTRALTADVDGDAHRAQFAHIIVSGTWPSGHDPDGPEDLFGERVDLGDPAAVRRRFPRLAAFRRDHPEQGAPELR